MPAPVHDVAVVVETPLGCWCGPARGVVVLWVGALHNFEVCDLFDKVHVDVKVLVKLPL